VPPTYSRTLGPSHSAGARPSFGSRLAGIEGVRAVAASSILVYHVWLYSSPTAERVELGPLDAVLPDLSFGVVLFFTLSGFLLYRPYVASLLRGHSPPSAAAYLRNRALRILPAYWAILLLLACVFQSLLVRDQAGLHNGSGLHLGLLARSALFVQGYFPSSVVTGIGPAWSLAVEVVFYLALPLLALGALRLARGVSSRSARRLAALAPAAALLAIGLSGKAAAAFLVPPAHPYAGWNADWHSVIERSFWCHADLFSFGMALAIVRIDWEDGLIRLPRGWRKLAIALALAGYLVTAKQTGLQEQLSYSPYNTLMAVTCTLLLALVVLPPRDATRLPLAVRVLETRIFVAAGLVSYSVFLWHEPLTRFLQEHGLTLGGPGGFFANLGLVAAVVGLLATLTYRFIEAPALRLKSSRAATPAPQPDLAPNELPTRRAEAL
jgi:peptidoglycan/LPS O-acetylase OafA/YrhL